MKRAVLAAAMLAVGVVAALPPAAQAATSPAEVQKLVTDSMTTVDNFAADPNLTWFKEHIKESKGIFICSQIVKAGFILGGSGGRCVFLAKAEHGWNGPAFYTIGTASIGFQAGVDVAEFVGLAMTQKAVDALMSTEVKAGGGMSVAAGPVGTGAGTNPSVDFLTYSRSKGLFGGVDVNGSVIKPSTDFNNVYYTKNQSEKGDVTPIGIIVKGAFHNPQASELIAKVDKLYAGAK